MFQTQAASWINPNSCKSRYRVPKTTKSCYLKQASSKRMTTRTSFQGSASLSQVMSQVSSLITSTLKLKLWSASLQKWPKVKTKIHLQICNLQTKVLLFLTIQKFRWSRKIRKFHTSKINRHLFLTMSWCSRSTQSKSTTTRTMMIQASTLLSSTRKTSLRVAKNWLCSISSRRGPSNPTLLRIKPLGKKRDFRCKRKMVGRSLPQRKK